MIKKKEEISNCTPVYEIVMTDAKLGALSMDRIERTVEALRAAEPSKETNLEEEEQKTKPGALWEGCEVRSGPGGGGGGNLCQGGHLNG